MAGDDAVVRRLRDAVSRLDSQTQGRPRTGLGHDDADETAGTVATDDAIGFDPFPLLAALAGHGARVVVIGQVAGIMHGSRELTGDLDLLWDGEARQAPAMAAAFASVAASLADGDGAPVRCGPAAFSLPKVLFRTALASGDCCTPALPWRDLAIGQFLSRCLVATAAPGFEIRYLARADLIQMRQAAGRVKDLRRARELGALAATT
ncbi:MAG: hypothetical protein ACRDNZ_19860 [Streptosporangiaceae bacterium]